MKKAIARKIPAIMLCVILAANLTSCGTAADLRVKIATPGGASITATADSITVENVATAGNAQAEYSLDGLTWQDQGVFTSLSPDTQYTVYIRAKETDDYLASDVYTRTVRTLKYEQAAPQEIGVEQADKTVTLTTGTEEGMEYSYDGGQTYTTSKTYTYTQTGDKTIMIRYAETAEKYVSDTYLVNIHISDFYNGHGTEEDPYIIKTPDHLLAVHDGESFEEPVFYRMEADISLRMKPRLTAPLPLTFGYLDGNGHTISDVTMAFTNQINCGLFYLPMEIKNLTLVNARMTVDKNKASSREYLEVGLLASRILRAKNCKASGTISVNSQIREESSIGGMFGALSAQIGYNTIESCSNDVDIQCTMPLSSWIWIGGLLGTGDVLSGKLYVRNCFAIGRIDANLHGGTIGGLVGRIANAFVEDCYSQLGIECITEGASYDKSIAGLVGSCNADVSIARCYSDSPIYVLTAEGAVYAGGIMTATESASVEVKSCFYSSSLFAQDQSGVKGAFVGYIRDRLQDGQSVVACFFNTDYEIDLSDGHTTACQESEGAVIRADGDALKTASWQIANLKWDNTVWKFVDGSYPKLL